MYSQIYLYLCSMKTKNRKNMTQKERNEVVPLLAIIATGATLCGLMIESTTFAVVGISMFLIPIYVAILGNRYF